MNGDASLVALDAPIPLSDAKTLAARLASDPTIEYAEPDLVLRPFLAPNDAGFHAAAMESACTDAPLTAARLP